jgi:hypothetical protein
MLIQEEVKVVEVEPSTLRKLVSGTGRRTSEAKGDACGGGCGRGANCSPRSAEMEAMLCGAD